MYEDHISAAVLQAVPARELRKLENGGGSRGRQQKPLTERVRSSTTIATMLFKDGVLCTADRKTSGWGYSILSQRSIKITKISSHSALLGSGSVADIQLAYQSLQNANSEFEEDNNGEKLSTAGQAHYLAKLLRLWTQFYGAGLSVGVLLAGFDSTAGPSMFSIDDDGCCMKRSDFATAGSGGERIEDQFDARWEPGLSFEAALDVAMHGMIHSGMRDSGSSPPIIALPTVVTVTAHGVQMISDRTIEQALGRALITKRGVRKSFARALIGGKE